MLGGNCADQDAVKIIDTPCTYLIGWRPDFSARSCPSTQASFSSHLWVLKQAGQRIGIEISDRESNLIASVVSPVGTALPNTGQRIMISGMM
jgi:hypothetical protein